MISENADRLYEWVSRTQVVRDLGAAYLLRAPKEAIYAANYSRIIQKLLFGWIISPSEMLKIGR